MYGYRRWDNPLEIVFDHTQSINTNLEYIEFFSYILTREREGYLSWRAYSIFTKYY